MILLCEVLTEEPEGEFTLEISLVWVKKPTKRVEVNARGECDKCGLNPASAYSVVKTWEPY